MTGSRNLSGLKINATGALYGSTNSDPWEGDPKHVYVKVKVTDNGCSKPKTYEHEFRINKPE
ncbi:MAG: hypothetical protein MUP69_10565 [Candidatus Atribacteria bacterium]|nr:hypothetical protein [Candidatus Atribacteria bacterium]